MRKAVEMTRELVDLLEQYSLTEKELSAPLPLISSSNSRDTSSISKDTYLPPGCEDICGDICKKMRREPSSLDNSVPSTSSQANSPIELTDNSSSKPCSQASSRNSEEVSFTFSQFYKLYTVCSWKFSWYSINIKITGFVHLWTDFFKIKLLKKELKCDCVVISLCDTT